MNLDLEQFTYEELRALNDLIVQRLKYLERTRTTEALARFRIGERVFFQAEGGEPVDGIIEKLNRKTATIKGDDGYMWRVSPQFLRKPGDSDKSGNIVELKPK